jgi:hypothetical protein
MMTEGDAEALRQREREQEEAPAQRDRSEEDKSKEFAAVPGTLGVLPLMDFFHAGASWRALRDGVGRRLRATCRQGCQCG